MRIKIRGTEDRTGGLQIQPIRDILEERGHGKRRDGGRSLHPFYKN